MILDENISDETLEYAARLIEEASFADLCGIAAKKKRDREDAALRFKTTHETRKRCADLIRAFKHRPDLHPLTILRQIASLSEADRHDAYLTDAWPLAWKGWLNIECTTVCNSNCLPQESHYRIVLTEEGHKQLADHARSRESAHNEGAKND